MSPSRFLIFVALPFVGGALSAEDPPPAREHPGPTLSETAIGTLEVGGHDDASVFLNEYKAFYDLQIAIPLEMKADGSTDPVDGDRFSAWLLLKDGKALPLRERPDKGSLVETSTGRSVSAHAMFEFAHDAPRDQLVAVVVQVDDALTVLAVPRKE
jgi:hypothetical protein